MRFRWAFGRCRWSRVSKYTYLHLHIWKMLSLWGKQLWTQTLCTGVQIKCLPAANFKYSVQSCVASPHNVICSDLCTGFKNVKTWRVSNPRRVSLLLELISQVYVTATPSRLSLLNLAIHRVVRECIVLLLCWQVNTHARLFVIYVRYIYDTTLCLLRVWKVVLFSGVISFQSLSVFLEACPP